MAFEVRLTMTNGSVRRPQIFLLHLPPTPPTYVRKFLFRSVFRNLRFSPPSWLAGNFKLNRNSPPSPPSHTRPRFPRHTFVEHIRITLRSPSSIIWINRILPIIDLLSFSARWYRFFVWHREKNITSKRVLECTLRSTFQFSLFRVETRRYTSWIRTLSV